MRILLLSLLGSSMITLSACGEKTVEVCDDGIDNDENGSLDCNDEACGGDAVCADLDADGFIAQDDCDDADASAYPGADEVCDEVDNNCDGNIDENPIDGEAFYLDTDGDGYGYFESIVSACAIEDGLSENPDDCDDDNAAISPDAEEVCDGIDNNCDYVTDSDATDRTVFYRDLDADGYGFDDATQEACALPDGFAEQGGDCDNYEAAAYPGAEEVCDGLDNDCDGEIDLNAVDGSLFYSDLDSDGFGDPDSEVTVCGEISGYVTDNTDCNDDNSGANPDELETCDGIDNNCDGLIDDDDPALVSASAISWYLDADGDGQGAEGSTAVETCEAPIDTTTGNIYVDNDDDCDDTSIVTYLGAPEICDGDDNDCDSVPDDKASDAVQYYLDLDGDGYGDDSNIVVDCSDPSTLGMPYVTQGGDCDDLDNSFNPGAVDTCDGFDQNCSGDESDVSGNNTFYIDLDGDGYGSMVSSILACDAPANFVVDGTDCDDLDANTMPGAPEVCDSVDNDCDGDIDQSDSDFDSATLITYYVDADGDGFGNEAIFVEDCSPRTGYVTDGTDCDDDATDADGDGVADGVAFNSSATEVYYDGIDQNCDGASDFDADQDGDDSIEYLGNCSDSQLTNQTDCEADGSCSDVIYVDQVSCEGNGDTWTFTGNTWNAIGTDCDDFSDSLSGVDEDGDGVTTCDGDCNDSALDEDGDGVADGFYTYPGLAYNEVDPSQCLTDLDGDGYGGLGTLGCFDFEMFDSYGDGWNGNQLEIYEDGVMTGSVTNQNLNGITGSSSGGEWNYETYCFDGSTEVVEIYFTDGSFNTEISFDMYDSSGALLGSGQGSGTYDLIFEGVTYTDGDMIFSQEVLSGMDCDDFDVSVGSIDVDADGASDCNNDCDPTDASLNVDDLDGDGFSTCDGDCDDYDATVYFGAPDAWYDGLDSNCDGADDFDADGDGEQDATAGYCDDSFYTNQADCEDAGSCSDVSYSSAVNCENNGVCADSQFTNELDCVGGSETWTDNTWLSDNNSWNLVNGTDCDDNNPDVYSTAAEVCDGLDNDCDGDIDDADLDIVPEDMNSFYEDLDGDGYGTDSSEVFACIPPAGYSFQGGDCNDDVNNNGPSFNPGITEIYYDGLDSDCDGGSDFDADQDGDDSIEYLGNCSDSQLTNQTDCEADGSCSDVIYVDQVSCEGNGDTWTFTGNTWNAIGTDCDDFSDSLSGVDEDGDGVTTCDGDCNDSALDEDGDGVADGFYTYPGLAYNEVDPSQCLTDLDGDGYGGLGTLGCFDFEMFDSYGDGWNGNQLEIYEDGVMTGSVTNQNLNGITGSSSGGEWNYETYCFDGSTEVVEIYFTDGSFNTEISFDMYDSSGALLGSGQGSGTYDLIFEGVTYTDGDMIFSQEVLSGNDCDDTDPAIGLEDADGDGVSVCNNDCDDNDPLNAGTFAEDCSDGQDNDCDGIADCADSDCEQDAACVESICDDGLDDDGDGDIDCDDSDCEISCFELICDDGLDDDGDGDIDCDDSDCLDDLVCMEASCTDGFDDDGDGDIDCDDSDCADNVTCQTECVDVGFDLGTAVGTAVAVGTNAGEIDDTDGSCSVAFGGEDVNFLWTAPASGTYTFSTIGSTYDTVLYASTSCVGEEIECNDDSNFNGGNTYSELLDMYVVGGETIVLTVDAYEYFESGTYSLDITSTFEGSCDDGLDDDADGLTDCADSDCSFDASCASLTCPNYDLGTMTGTSLMNGDLSGAMVDQFEASCLGSTSATGEDYIIAWEASESGCATFETSGSMNAVLALFDSCPDNGGSEIACQDGSGNNAILDFDVTAGAVYYLGLDTYNSSSTYGLDINIEANISCN